jgi:prevent-host-death family protein
MRVINVYEAKTHLSQLLAAVAAGEEIIMARAGKPLAKLVPYQEVVEPRTPGYWRGRVRIAPDFDELPDALTAYCQRPRNMVDDEPTERPA